MKTGIHHFAICLLLLIEWSQAAQPADVRDFNVVSREWVLEDGLDGGRLYSITQTPDGQLWMGNQIGLHRYDGRRFQHYDPKDLGDAGHSRVINLIVDKDGSLWIGTLSNDIFHYRDGSFHQLETTYKVNGSWYPHPEGGVLVSNNQLGKTELIRIRTDGVSLIGTTPLKEIWRAAVSEDGRIWISERNGRLHEWVGGKLVEFLPQDAGGFTTLPDGSLITTGRTAAHIWRDGKWQEYRRYAEKLRERTPPGECVMDTEGRLWLSAAAESRWVCESNGSFYELLSSSRGIPGGITQFLRDSSGDLWVATIAGLYQLRYRPFVHWDASDELPSSKIISVAPTPDGGAWFSCFGAVGRFAPGSSRLVATEERRPNIGTLVACGNDGALWSADRLGYMTYQPSGGSTPIKVGWEYGATSVHHLIVDNKGIAWLACKKGLYRCDPSAEPIHYERISGRNGLPNGIFQWVTIDDSATMYAINRGSGMHVSTDGGHTWKASPIMDKIPPLVTNNYTMDSDGILWGSRPKAFSINCWSENFSGNATLASLGLGDVTLRGIQADNMGGLWLTTASSGLIRIHAKNLLSYMTDGKSTVVVDRFTTSEGLPSMGSSYLAQSTALDTKGRVWFAMNGGIAMIDPAIWRQRQAKAQPTRMQIVSMNAGDDQPVAMDQDGEPITLPPDTDELSFEFASSTIALPGELKYKHRLVGYDEQWSHPSNEPIAEFRKLEPGKYRLEVVAADLFGIWSDPPASVEFTIQPQWWEIPVVRWLFAVGIIGVIVLLFWKRLESIRRKAIAQREFSRQLIDSQEAERRRIAAELHDGLGQSLLVLKNLASLNAQTSNDDEGFREIADTAGHAIEEVRGISRALRPPELDRLGLAKAVQATARRVAESSSIDVEVKIEGELPKLESDVEIAIFRIFQEALNNAVKHAEADQIKVSMNHKAYSLTLDVSDDGKGLQSDSSSSPGLGLTSMRERAELIGGVLWIGPSVGGGTRVSVKVPTDH